MPLLHFVDTTRRGIFSWYQHDIALWEQLPLGKSNQGNQGYSGNQENVIQGQRPDMEYRHTQQRT